MQTFADLDQNWQIQQIQSQENTGKDLKISKTGMADRWVIVQVKKIDRLECVAI